MASSEETGRGRRQRRLLYNVREVLELLQTPGSDVEEEDDDSESEDMSEPESIESESSSEDDGGRVSDESLGGGDSDASSSEESVEGGDGEITAERIVELLAKDWHQDFTLFPCVPHYSAPDTAGLHLGVMENHAPLAFFDTIFDKTLMQVIVRETNRYAQENIGAKGALPPHSLFRQWSAISEKKLVGFFAILVHMGLVHKPEVSDYWSTDPTMQSSFAPAIMSRDKFQLILAMLHVSNNAEFIPRGRPEHNPLHKIQPVYTHLRTKFKELYVPEENICIDEAMCPWRGKVGFRVYMRDKPVRWGMKLYELCESTSAYVYDFEIFAADPRISNRPVDVVMRLAEPLLDHGRCVYVDNYYCYPELAEKLVDRDTHCVGTVRPNRLGLPKRELAAPVERGTVLAFRQGGVGVLKWMDKKPVHLLTTKMDPRVMERVISRSGDKNKPSAVQDYIRNMAGVDKSDQLMAYMPLKRKTIKWWKKMFFHLFTLSIIQAYILYEKFHDAPGHRKSSLKKFVVALGNGLSERYHSLPDQPAAESAMEPAVEPAPGPSGEPAPGPSREPAPGPSREPVPGPSGEPAPGPSGGPAVAPQRPPAPPLFVPETRLAGDHYSSRIGVYHTGRPVFRNCFVCTARAARQPTVARRRQTPNWCNKCGKALCVDKPAWGRQITCFQVYHSMKNFADY